VAGYLAVGFGLAELGFFGGALVGGEGAAGVEVAAGWWVGGVGGFAAEDDSLASGFDAGVGYGDAGDEGVGVGVLGDAVEVGTGCDFDDSSEVHDGDAVADVADYGEVVGDEEVGEAEFGLEVCEEG